MHIYFILFQSQCWPNCTKILSTWFTEKQKNTVFGLFGTCAFAGGIAASGLAVRNCIPLSDWCIWPNHSSLYTIGDCADQYVTPESRYI